MVSTLDIDQDPGIIKLHWMNVGIPVLVKLCLYPTVDTSSIYGVSMMTIILPYELNEITLYRSISEHTNKEPK